MAEEEKKDNVLTKLAGRISAAEAGAKHQMEMEQMAQSRMDEKYDEEARQEARRKRRAMVVNSISELGSGIANMFAAANGATPYTLTSSLPKQAEEYKQIFERRRAQREALDERMSKYRLEAFKNSLAARSKAEADEASYDRLMETLNARDVNNQRNNETALTKNRETNESRERIAIGKNETEYEIQKLRSQTSAANKGADVAARQSAQQAKTEAEERKNVNALVRSMVSKGYSPEEINRTIEKLGYKISPSAATGEKIDLGITWK